MGRGQRAGELITSHNSYFQFHTSHADEESKYIAKYNMRMASNNVVFRMPKCVVVVRISKVK